MTNEQTNPGILRREDAQQALGCSSTKLYGLLATGKLKAHKSGRHLVFKASDIEAYVDALPPFRSRGVGRRP